MSSAAAALTVTLGMPSTLAIFDLSCKAIHACR